VSLHPDLLLRSPELHGLTLELCQTGQDNLKSIKGSRPVWPELKNIFSQPHVDTALDAMHADVISVLLLSFPHLFPPASNEWKPGVDKGHYVTIWKRQTDGSWKLSMDVGLPQ
jgi:ketosteroid isomerase-like protein